MNHSLHLTEVNTDVTDHFASFYTFRDYYRLLSPGPIMDFWLRRAFNLINICVLMGFAYHDPIGGVIATACYAIVLTAGLIYHRQTRG